MVDPIDRAINGWGSGFGNWFFEVITNTMAVWFLFFVVALPLAISYFTGRKGTEKKRFIFGYILIRFRNLCYS